MSEIPKLQQTPPDKPENVIRTVNQMLFGSSNCVGSVTLTNNGTTTTLVNPLITPVSKIFFQPTTANAATVTGLYADKTSVPVMGNFYGGQITLHHSAVAQADLTFDYMVMV